MNFPSIATTHMCEKILEYSAASVRLAISKEMSTAGKGQGQHSLLYSYTKCFFGPRRCHYLFRGPYRVSRHEIIASVSSFSALFRVVITAFLTLFTVNEISESSGVGLFTSPCSSMSWPKGPRAIGNISRCRVLALVRPR